MTIIYEWGLINFAEQWQSLLCYLSDNLSFKLFKQAELAQPCFYSECSNLPAPFNYPRCTIHLVRRTQMRIDPKYWCEFGRTSVGQISNQWCNVSHKSQKSSRLIYWPITWKCFRLVKMHRQSLYADVRGKCSTSILIYKFSRGNVPVSLFISFLSLSFFLFVLLSASHPFLKNCYLTLKGISCKLLRWWWVMIGIRKTYH